MNGSGFFLAALLLVVLIAVAFGAQQLDNMRAEQYQQLMQQRDEAVKLAQEAQAQNDHKTGELALLQARLADMQAGIQQKDDQIRAIAVERDETVKIANERRAQVVYLQEKNAELQQQVNTLLAQASPQIPVSGGSANQPAQNAASYNNPSQGGTLSLSGLVNQSGIPLQAGLVAGLIALAGLATLGGGGYVVLRHESGRKR